MPVDQAALQVARIIHQLANPRQTYLFGSRATGTHSPQSDVDLAVITDQAPRPEWLRQIRDQARELQRKHVPEASGAEVISITTSRFQQSRYQRNSIAHHIAKHGVPVGPESPFDNLQEQTRLGTDRLGRRPRPPGRRQQHGLRPVPGTPGRPDGPDVQQGLGPYRSDSAGDHLQSTAGSTRLRLPQVGPGRPQPPDTRRPAPPGPRLAPGTAHPRPAAPLSDQFRRQPSVRRGTPAPGQDPCRQGRGPDRPHTQRNGDPGYPKGTVMTTTHQTRHF